MIAPEFDTTFPNLATFQKIRTWCPVVRQEEEEENGVAGQDLTHFVATHATATLHPVLIAWSPPNVALHQQLAQNPCVGLPHHQPPQPGTVTVTSSFTTTRLTPSTLAAVTRLAVGTLVSRIIRRKARMYRVYNFYDSVVYFVVIPVSLFVSLLLLFFLNLFLCLPVPVPPSGPFLFLANLWCYIDCFLLRVFFFSFSIVQLPTIVYTISLFWVVYCCHYYFILVVFAMFDSIVFFFIWV